MTVVARRPGPGASETRQKGSFTQRKNSGSEDSANVEARRGFLARLASRRKSDPLASDGPRDGHRRMGRMLELVSVGRANLRVMAAGSREQGHRRGRNQEEQSDENSSSPSPPASTQHRVESPDVGFDDQRSRTPSSDGLKDMICYCLCIPRCH
ncbi:hypothetical protein CONPUDRAFT_168303 [Coniophora puteana RWD-64-598 SS2]|uniref:Uncharacterized protein n=1 Tax=Coniophora puteana (strain RWD-64-598) TaxID=741705 RepID=A0A5M3MFJ4_CONPW|nr:uncharacterized protein CONPUDRAFT_168303 [Coniophora puteana RWD-64-598 SS2]EIW77361.1 hypothetical protein CONPUDRAFT_168303 [Coniophora puteana RWD-64-598 SS2]